MRHEECAIVLTLIIKWGKRVGGRVGGRERERKNEEVTVAVTGTFALEPCFPRVVIT